MRLPQDLRRIAVLLASAAAMVLAPAAAFAQSVLELRPYVGQLRTVDVVIAGRPARMLFDTGAGFTSVTPEFAAQIGCQPFGHVTGFRMDGERVAFQRCPEARLDLGARRVTLELGVFDLGAVLPEGLPHLDGVMGLDVFRGAAITLDRLEQLRIETRSSLRRAVRGLEAGRLRSLRDAAGSLTLFASAATPHGDAWLLLDSANLDSVRLHPWVYQALAPEADADGPAREVTLSVEGAGPSVAAPTIVPELIYDGALDARFMRRHAITLDLERERVWWRRVGE
jgi:hypothetical protein